MPFRDAEPEDNAIVVIVQILALLIAFAVPVGLLLLVFPDHSRRIVLVSVYGFFAISALFAGVGWTDPNYSLAGKFYTKWIIVFTVIAMAVSKWYSAPPEQEVSDWAVAVLIRTAILVLPFFVGRFISSQVTNASQPKAKSSPGDH